MEKLCQHYIDFSTTYGPEETRAIVNRVIAMAGASGASIHPVDGYWQGIQEKAWRLIFIGEQIVAERIAEYLRVAFFQDVVILSSSVAQVIYIDRKGAHVSKDCTYEETKTQTYYPNGD